MYMFIVKKKINYEVKGFIMKKAKCVCKRVLAGLLVCVSLFNVWACTDETGSNKNSSSDSQEEATPQVTTTTGKQEPQPVADPIDALSKLEGVISLTEYSGNLNSQTVAYQLVFASGENKELEISAELILHKEFVKNDASLMFYYPEVSNMAINDVANMFVSKKVGVVRLFARGFGGSQGMRDLGGNDLSDALTLFSLCEKAGLTEGRRIYAAGSSEGSITALRMAEQLGDKLSGVSAVDLISDVEEYCKYRGEAIAALFDSLIGTQEDMTNAYRVRSACYFVHEIKCPVLLIEYKDHPAFPKEQYDLFETAMNNAAVDYERYTVDAIKSDYVGDSGKILLSWIASHE